MNDTFISRIDGRVHKTNGRRTINEQPENNPNTVAFGKLGITFNDNMHDSTFITYLYNTWSFPHDLIDKVFAYFENNVDATNEFLNIYDSTDDLEEAWEIFCEKYNSPDTYPF